MYGFGAADGFVVELASLLPQFDAGATLRVSRPADKGIIVLGINKVDGSFHGAPGPEDTLDIGDVAVIYGLESDLTKLHGKRTS